MPSSKIPPKIIGVPWRLSEVWNTTLDNMQDRPYIPRDYCYASEMGGAFCDRYLKMYAVPMTNKPNVRSRRKFQAGFMWEWILGMVFISSGMLKKQQIRVERNIPKMLRVSGRLDYVLGAPADWNLAKDNIKRLQDGMMALGLDAPPFIYTAIDKFMDQYKGQLLRDYIGEMKSLSSFMMEKVKKLNAPLDHHKLQIHHYVSGNDQGYDNGKAFYVCKDDCILDEFDVRKDDGTETIYRKDLKQMTSFYNEGFNKKNPKSLMPPVEPLVLFDEGLYKFSKNWKVEYSQFLTYLYGYENPESYRMTWQRRVNSWNRVMKRCILGEKITDKNKEVIADGLKVFPKWDKYVALGKKAGAFAKPEEQEETED